MEVLCFLLRCYNKKGNAALWVLLLNIIAMKRTIISFLAVAAVVAGLVSCKGNSDTKYKVVVEAVNSLENGRIAWKSGEPIVMWDDSMEPVQIAVNELGEDRSMAQFTLNDSVETQGICRFVHPASMYKGNGVVAIPTKQNACMKVTDLPSYAEVAGDGTDVAVLTIGPLGNDVEEVIATLAATNPSLSVAHYDMRFLKPLDEQLLHEVGQRFRRIVTIEDGVRNGGFGSAILEWMSDHGYQPQMTRLGLPDSFVEHGTIDELRHIVGLDRQSILNAIQGISDAHDLNSNSQL